MIRIIIVFLLTFYMSLLSVNAQQIQIVHLHKVEGVSKDKERAQLDLIAAEKGFSFFQGSHPLEVEETDEGYRLSLPHKTRHLFVTHTDLGVFQWCIPNNGLKKKKCYQAELLCNDPHQEFHQQFQWLVIKVNPKNSVIAIDSTLHTPSHGVLSLYLPIGQHTCKIMSPFYKTVNDTITLEKEQRMDLNIDLSPFYSYLTVKGAKPMAIIEIDGQPLGKGNIQTGRIAPGNYHIQIHDTDTLYYDDKIWVENAQHFVLDLADNTNYTPQPIPLPKKQNPPYQENEEAPVPTTPVPELYTKGTTVHLTAFDDATEIWLNREIIGQGEWKGILMPGFYGVSTSKDGKTSRTRYFWVEQDKPIELHLQHPSNDYGGLNITSNVLHANIYLDGIKVGTTPAVISNLPAERNYHIYVEKGDLSYEGTVHVQNNRILDINIKIK